METTKLPSRSVTYFTLCGMVLLVIILLMIYPDYRSMAALDNNIEDLNIKLETQKLLFPVFQKMLKEIQLKKPEDLTFPKTEKLTPEKAEHISSVFHDIARKTRLNVEEISPDVDSSLSGSGNLMMNVVLKGNFFSFRDLLVELSQIPYLEHIEEIKLQGVEGGRKISLKIWLAKKAND